MEFRVDKRWLIAGGIAAAFLVAFGIVVLVLASGGSSKSAADEPASDVEIAELEKEFEEDIGSAVSECIALWNKPSNSYGRQLISSSGPPYVNVTFSETYPDRCLVTAANPSSGQAYQFLQGGQASGEGEGAAELGPFGYPAWQGSANGLEGEVTEWNASANAEGYLKLAP